MPIDPSPLQLLQFQGTFRKYQRIMLNVYEDRKEDKYHIVAPPGSGKTIIGLEIIRREGKPAVIFSPTTTIQLQWKEKLSLFTPPNAGFTRDSILSLNPEELRPINSFTYQLISTSGENLEFVENAAKEQWRNELLDTHVVATDEEATRRIEEMKTNNHDAYDKEISRHYKRVKDRLLREPSFDGSKLLHRNAQALIERLSSEGVKIVVLDEVHHLLDYWALVIRELVRRIPGVKVIGLTATPPYGDFDDTLENYYALVGDIDFEVPTPALVKEGNLAPYQDLVFFCRPSAREKEYITSIGSRFNLLTKRLQETPDFREWVKRRILNHNTLEEKEGDWISFYNAYPFLAVAGVKFLHQIEKLTLSSDIVIDDVEGELNPDDWIQLITDYALNYLKLEKERHTEYKEIKETLASLGLILTERGSQQGRSLTDKILAFSESKTTSTITILTREMRSMEQELRAVVVTDYEKLSASTIKGIEDVLDPKAGSAIGVFRALAADSEATKLDPILVTGSVLMLDADNKNLLLTEMEKWRIDNHLDFTLNVVETEFTNVVKIQGSGKDWGTRSYVRMVTSLFERGVTRCIVGTRSLLGEGWDSLRLNTLIDLTQTTTYASVNQLRGRGIRLDPQQPWKVTNNWDVVCIEPDFFKGRRDFERFVKKHEAHYGVSKNGEVVKGLMHIDMTLQQLVTGWTFDRVAYMFENIEMLNQCEKRVEAYQRWKIGKEYMNFEYSATKVDPADIKFRTAYAMRDTLLALFNLILLGVLSSVSITIWLYGKIFGSYNQFDAVSFTILAIIFFTVSVFSLYKTLPKYFRKAFVELPIDSHLKGIAFAVFESLQDAGLLDKKLTMDVIRITEDKAFHYNVHLDYASAADLKKFSKAYSEVLSPVVDQRYIVSRSIDDIKLSFYSPLYWTIRRVTRFFKQEDIAYHPVPSELSVNQERAQIFQKSWRRYVGGDRLIYTRSDEGRKILLRIRSKRRNKIKHFNFSAWK